MGLHDRRTATAALAAMALMGAGLAASVAVAAEPANLAFAPAPRQFIAFCQRDPMECRAETPAMAAAGAETTYVTAAGGDRFNWSSAFATTAPRKSESHPRAWATPASGIALAQLNRINRQVNRTVHFRTDAASFGVEDVWSLPTLGEDGLLYGDCEDYALKKRSVLMAEGVASDALSLAVVRTGRGEIHAVLLVRTDAGEMMLDSLTSWVVPWEKSAYTLIARQAAGEAGAWVQPA